MNIVSFLCPRTSHQRWDARYYQLLDVLQHSCDRLGLRHVVLTDDANLSGRCPRPVQTFLVHQTPKELMQATHFTQWRWIHAGNWGMDGNGKQDTGTLFVGADAIMLTDPDISFNEGPDAFHGAYDIAFTIRYDGGKHPINTGAIVVQPWARQKAAEFFERVYKDTKTHWCADQEALHRALLPLPPECGVYERAGMQVAFLDMNKFNVRPLSADDPMPGFPMFHFRGKWDRKQVMIEWARKHLGYKL